MPPEWKMKTVSRRGVAKKKRVGKSGTEGGGRRKRERSEVQEHVLLFYY